MIFVIQIYTIQIAKYRSIQLSKQKSRSTRWPLLHMISVPYTAQYPIVAFDCISLSKVPIMTSFHPTPILLANYSDSNKEYTLELHQIYPESARIQDQWGSYYI